MYIVYWNSYAVAMCYLKHTVNHDDDDDVYYPRGEGQKDKNKFLIDGGLY